MNEEHLAKISFLNKIKDDLEQEQGSSLAKIEWWEKKNESLTSSEQRWDGLVRERKGGEEFRV